MPIIDIKNCSIWREKKILDDFSLTLEEFEHLAIVGPNGSGKSTFIAMLMRELHPSRAEKIVPQIKILDRTCWNIFELRKIIALVSPKFSENLLLAAPLIVEDAVMSALFGTYGFFADEKASKTQVLEAEKILCSLNLWHLRHRCVSQLSTGELRKILIARAMILHPKIILLDEPTSGLDIAAQNDFLQFMQQIAAKTTIVMVTHHLEEIMPQIKKVLLIKEGKIFRFGDKKEILNAENLSELFGVDIGLNLSQDETYSMYRK